MKVLILGAPRTGTTSVGKALTILGYKVHKGVGHSFTEKNHLPEFTSAIRAKYYGEGRQYTKQDYDRFIGCYDGAHGLGLAALSDELVQAYPEAKVILMPRDPATWIESWNASSIHFGHRWQKWRWLWLLTGGIERDFQLFRETAVPCWSYGHPFDSKEQQQFYVDYNQHVRDIVPKERLLEFLPQQGWRPLCDFLGVPVPEDTDFPHATARSSLQNDMAVLRKRGFEKAMIRIASALGLLIALMSILKMMF